jgi:hypothetical protein
LITNSAYWFLRSAAYYDNTMKLSSLLSFLFFVGWSVNLTPQNSDFYNFKVSSYIPESSSVTMADLREKFNCVNLACRMRRLDINQDAHDEYLVSTVDTCGNAGCFMDFYDGASQKHIGRIMGNFIYFSKKLINGYPMIHASAHIDAQKSSWSCYIFDGKEYIVALSTVQSGKTLYESSVILQTVPEK